MSLGDLVALIQVMTPADNSGREGGQRWNILFYSGSVFPQPNFCHSTPRRANCNPAPIGD